MDNKVQKMFVINMFLNGISKEEIADTLNVPIDTIETIITENEELIKERRKLKEKNKINSETEERDIIKTEETPEPSPEEDEVKKENVQDENRRKFVNSNKKNKTLSDLRDRIVRGQDYSMEEVKDVAKRVKRTCMVRRNIDLVQGLVEIYLQLNLYTNAKAFVRDIYDEEERLREGMVNEIEKQELRYHVMKQYRSGSSYADISNSLSIYTTDAIRIVREEQQIDDLIIRMSQRGRSKEEIIDGLNVNIERINTVLNMRTRQEEVSER